MTGELTIDPELHLEAPSTRRLIVGSPTQANRRAQPMWTGITTSTTISSPGGYVVRTAGVTLTLLPSARGGPVSLKVLATPVTVVDAAGAPFDAGAATFTLSEPAEAVTFSWSEEDGAWLVS